MKPSPFNYYCPASVDEAVQLLSDLEDAKILAGGQSLIPLMNFRLATPEHLIDISGLAELSEIKVDPDEVEIGASVTHSQVLQSEQIGSQLPLLWEAEKLVAHEVIRNRGTLCGSLAHADPAGEMTAVLSVLRGKVQTASVSGGRTIEATDLFEGPLQSSLRDDELIVSATFPTLGPNAVSSFREVARRHGDYAVAGAVSVVEYDDNSLVCSAQAAFLSVGPVPTLISLDDLLVGHRIEDVGYTEIYNFLSSQLDPHGDLQTSADYRRHLAAEMGWASLEACT